MKLNTKLFAAYVGAAMGVVYIICAIMVWLAPALATTLMNWVFHTVTIEQRTITPVGFIAGLVQVIIYTYIISALVALSFNKSLTEKQTTSGN